MFDFSEKFPELLKIKGYKYRAKMIIAALVILIAVIIILSSVIGKISSAINNKTDDNTSGQSVSSQITAPPSSVPESNPQGSDTDTEAMTSVISKREYDRDADGKIIIDTDTFDGKKAVAITFDDGPGEYTKELIEGLNERNVKATFFMLGNCISKYPEVLPLMVEGGHQLGSHTYDHLDITKLSKKQISEQLSKTDNEIYNACGQRATAFRPPYGSYNDGIISEINKTITLWSLDSEDWKSRNAESVKKKIVSSCSDGDIILLHDIYKTSVDGALQAIDELQKNGFVFVTVDELMSRFGYDVEHGEAYNAQFAVYETNSPYAEKYESEIEASRAAMEAASAASEFYYDTDDSDFSDTTTEITSDKSTTSSSSVANFPQNSKVPSIY